MNHPLPDMMDTTMGKIREMIGANAIVGDPIQTSDGVTILPISKVSFGFAGGGSDFVPKNLGSRDNPFGGGTGAGVTITPIAFLIIRGEHVRMMPIAMPADSTVDRLLEQLPDLLDKVGDFIDKRTEKAASAAAEQAE